MDFNMKKNNQILKDDMNIKLHLDTSLDMGGISISEELINKTLAAIRQQAPASVTGISDWKEGTKTGRTSRALWIRGLTSVAAAALILVVGINAFRLIGSFGSKADKGSGNGSRNYTSQNESYDTEGAENKAESSMQFATKSASDINADESAPMDDKLTAERAEITGSAPAPSEMDSSADSGVNPAGINDKDLFTLTFGDICPISREAAVSIDITDVNAEASILLSDKAGIENLYNLMDNHVFAEGSASSGNDIYVIRINGDGAVFSVTAEDAGIITLYSYGNEASEGSYITQDHKLFLTQLQELIGKYGNN